MRHHVPAPRKGVVGLWWGIFTSLRSLPENLGVFLALQLSGDSLHLYFTISKPWKKTIRFSNTRAHSALSRALATGPGVLAGVPAWKGCVGPQSAGGRFSLSPGTVAVAGEGYGRNPASAQHRVLFCPACAVMLRCAARAVILLPTPWGQLWGVN